MLNESHITSCKLPRALTDRPPLSEDSGASEDLGAVLFPARLGLRNLKLPTPRQQ